MTVIVKWETTTEGKRGPSAYRQRKTFRGEDARSLAEHYVAHVVSRDDPEWYSIEEVQS